MILLVFILMNKMNFLFFIQ